MKLKTFFIFALDVFQSLFLDSYPVGMIVVAVIRLRIASCQVNCDVSVRWTFYCLTSTAFVAIQILFAVSKFIISVLVTIPAEFDRHEIEAQIIFCNDVSMHGPDYVGIVSAFVLYCIPSLSVTVIYVKIVQISSSSIRRIIQYRTSGGTPIAAQTHRSSILPVFRSPNTVSPLHSRNCSIVNVPMTQFNGNDNFQRGLKIQKSVFTMVTCFLVSTIPVSIMEICRCVIKTSMTFNIALIYLKVFMCIFHAIGEGILHKEKRDKITLFIDKFLKRTSFYRGPNSTDPGRLSLDRANLNPMYPRLACLSTLNEESFQNSAITNGDDVFLDEFHADKVRKNSRLSVGSLKSAQGKSSLTGTSSNKCQNEAFLDNTTRQSSHDNAIDTIFETKEKVELEAKSEDSIVIESISDYDETPSYEKERARKKSCDSGQLTVHPRKNEEQSLHDTVISKCALNVSEQQPKGTKTADKTDNSRGPSKNGFYDKTARGDEKLNEVYSKSKNVRSSRASSSNRTRVQSTRSKSRSDDGIHVTVQTPRKVSSSTRFLFFYQCGSRPTSPGKTSPKVVERCKKSSLSLYYIPEMPHHRTTTSVVKYMPNGSRFSIESFPSNTPAFSDVTLCSRRSSYDRLGGISSVSDILDNDVNTCQFHQDEKSPALLETEIPGDVIGSYHKISNISDTL